MKEIAFGVIVLMLVMFGVVFVDGVSCESRWESSGIKSSYSFMGGCKLHIDNKWIPETAYRAVE